MRRCCCCCATWRQYHVIVIATCRTVPRLTGVTTGQFCVHCSDVLIPPPDGRFAYEIFIQMVGAVRDVTRGYDGRHDPGSRVITPTNHDAAVTHRRHLRAVIVVVGSTIHNTARLTQVSSNGSTVISLIDEIDHDTKPATVSRVTYF